jgi:peptidoglycan/LPS O-acetylase OafA/YrhL
LFDIFTRKSQSGGRKLFSIFSLANNIQKLMRIENLKSQIRCIDGMKVLAAFYIILGHRYEFSRHQPSLSELQKQVNRFIYGYQFGLDVFFVCSGVLLTMSLLRNFEK